MTIELTRDMIPNGVRVVSFAPGKLLRIRVPLPIVTRVMFFIVNLVLCLAVAQAVSFVLSAIFGWHHLIPFGCNAAVIFVCILMNMRGAVLTIFLAKPRYRLSSPVSLVVRDGVPKVEATTTNNAGRWTSTLSIAGQAITTNTSELSAAGVGRPFAPFIAAFARPAAAAAVGQDAECPATGAAGPPNLPPAKERALPAALRPGRPRKRPLVILIHGTWGRQSAWAFPDKSYLVPALESRLTCEVEWRHYGWSGANRNRARIKAAARLAAMIRSELAEHNRSIFILAHSHGGNIAIRAIDDLSDAEQRSVQAVLMATPFLRSGQRFDVRDVYAVMPRFIQENLRSISMLGFCFASWVLIVTLQRYLPADIRIGGLPGLGVIISMWQLPLVVLYFFGPVFLFDIIWRKGAEFLKALQKENTELEQKESTRDPSRLLVISYNQDEAFQVLSLLINLLGLVHQMAFLAIMGIARLASRTRLLDLVWRGLWIVFASLLLLAGAGIAMRMILTPLAGVLTPVGRLLQIDAWITKTLGSAMDIDTRGMVLALFGTGLVVIAIIFSMLMIGIVRIGIFSAIGVMDQVRNQGDFFNAILGTVDVSVVPRGESEALLLPGRALFNHVKIYDDERTIDRIARCIRETVRIDA